MPAGLWGIEDGIPTGWSIVQCGACKSRTRLGDVSPRVVSSEVGEYCTKCGSKSTHTVEEVVPYWESFGIDEGLPAGVKTGALVEGIFKLWSPSSGDAIRFGDYLKKTLVELGLITKGSDD